MRRCNETHSDSSLQPAFTQSALDAEILRSLREQKQAEDQRGAPMHIWLFLVGSVEQDLWQHARPGKQRPLCAEESVAAGY